MANENNTQNDPNTFDLDAALEEKFQEVQQDLKRMRAIDAATESKIVPSAPQPIEEPADAPVPQIPEALENTASETPPETAPLESESAPMPEAPSVPPIEESKPDLQTPPDGGDLAKDTATDAAKERKQRYKKRRSMLIAKNVGSVLRVFSMGISAAPFSCWWERVLQNLRKRIESLQAFRNFPGRLWLMALTPKM